MNPAAGKYYDHEPAWRGRQAKGWHGWDECFDPRDINMFREQGFLKAGDRVLELGCGAGEAAILLAGFGCWVDACDASPTAIAMAENRREHLTPEVAERVRFYCSDALARPAMRFDTYDAVLDIHCLHCLVTPEDRRSFMTTAWQALRPDGLFLSANMCGLPNSPEMLAGVDPATRIALDGRRYFAEEDEIRRMLEEAGFKVVFRTRRCCPADVDDLLLAARR